MPIYEYECEKCGQITEALQGFNDPPLKKCKHCKGKVNRIISLSSFQLTGTGWYSTDYAKGPGIPSKAADQDNPAIADSGNGNGHKAEEEPKPKKIRKSGMANMEKSDVKVPPPPSKS